MYDVVLCTYVLNVVDQKERLKIIDQLKRLINPWGDIYITVRKDIKNHIISKRGTHQYPVKLPYEIIEKNSSFCIYKLNAR